MTLSKKQSSFISGLKAANQVAQHRCKLIQLLTIKKSGGAVLMKLYSYYKKTCVLFTLNSGFSSPGMPLPSFWSGFHSTLPSRGFQCAYFVNSRLHAAFMAVLAILNENGGFLQSCLASFMVSASDQPGGLLVYDASSKAVLASKYCR
jgi:hypothetical protein